jgi:hypothetical protein
MQARDKARLTEETAPFADYLDINEATAELGFKHAQYTRRLLHESVTAIGEGKEPKFPWPTDDRPLALKMDMGPFEKWFINPTSVAGYAPKATGIGQGMSRWILRINPDAHTDKEFFEALEAAFGEQSKDNYLLEKQKSSKKKGGTSTPKDYTATILASLTKPIPSRQSMARQTGDNRKGKGKGAEKEEGSDLD